MSLWSGNLIAITFKPTFWIGLGGEKKYIKMEKPLDFNRNNQYTIDVMLINPLLL